MKKFVIIYFKVPLKDLDLLYGWISQQNIPLILENFAFFKNEFSLLENSLAIQALLGNNNFIYLIELTNNIININTMETTLDELNLNSILDKINIYGIESLTELEQKFLDNL